MRKRIAIIVGHTKKEQGAINYKGESEYDFNSRIALKISSYLNKISCNADIRTYFRDNLGRLGVANLIKEYRADISLELHFNSFRKVTHGCEVLALEHDKESIKYADILTNQLAEKFLLQQRHGDGVKRIKDGNRGYYNLKLLESIPISLLVEPCFANNETAESKAIFEDEEKYAAVIGNFLNSLVEKDNQTISYLDEKIKKQNNDILKIKKVMIEIEPSLKDKDISTDFIINRIRDAYKKVDDYSEILDEQVEHWDELTSTIGKAVEDIIEKSNKTWKSRGLA